MIHYHHWSLHERRYRWLPLKTLRCKCGAWMPTVRQLYTELKGK